MQYLAKLTIIGLLLFLLSSCQALQTGKTGPSWLDHPYDKSYDAQTYLCAVGSGSTREKAVDAALTGLSEIFNSEVSSQTQVTSLSTATKDEQGMMQFTEASELLEVGSVQTNTEAIIGAEVVNTFINDVGRVFVRVALNRAHAIELYRSQVSPLSSSLSQIKTKAALASDPLRSYVHLVHARSIAVQEQALLDILQVLEKKSQPSVLVALDRQLTDLAQSISISVQVRAEDTATEQMLHAAFAQGMQKLGFTITDEAGDAVLEINYDVQPINMPDSPYRYARYFLSVQLKGHGERYVSYEKNDREAALSESDAIAKALRNATTTAVDEVRTLLLQTLEAET
ncbi:MAG: hypothetical protein AB7C91_07145 [Sphaerochaeta sp.]|uniref:hypothetical protein n=1 Tax=Sphaerochaeta sp. TaxID=1972642 RepID=UPI003D0F56CD